jgi:hypothetical protein
MDGGKIKGDVYYDARDIAKVLKISDKDVKFWMKNWERGNEHDGQGDVLSFNGHPCLPFVVALGRRGKTRYVRGDQLLDFVNSNDELLKYPRVETQ